MRLSLHLVLVTAALSALLTSSASALPQGIQAGSYRVAQESTEDILARADEATRSRNFTEALTLYARVLEIDPRNYRALFQSGWICNEQEKDGEASRFLSRAVESKPDQANAWVELGLAQSRLFNTDQAVESYRKALAIKEDLTSAWLGLGDLFFNFKRDYVAATEAYLKVAPLLPDNALVNYRLGWCLGERGNYKDAETYLIKATQANGRLLAAHTELGYCRLKLQKWEGAREVLERALALDRKSKLANYYLGLAYLGLGQTQEAQRQADLLLDLAPPTGQKLEQKIRSRDLTP